ncbi:inositol hexakisphosphate kinase 1 isoform X1 [Lingula anatina]|uniref:Kinase n=1 Tax=Lingula anatina TaxID=7574 RepID=A0A1S3KAL1_LINAN|nr:inositol hexakisphosphate kinase 1 isoform X1 [Lingula anatina]|eukprot:XP_013419479.1 inositol hexakisphosphate kinase 1 isoform X1 [Lingula anatina]
MPEGIMDVKEIWEPVPLEPYVHQVGGTSSVLKFDDTTLCKPLIAREHHFYKTMPSAMKEFTPGYRGAIEVAFHEDSKGYLTLIGYPPGCHDKVRLWREAQESSGSCGEGEDQSDEEEEEEDSETRRLPMQQSKGNGKEALRVRMRRTGSIDFEGDVEVLDNTDQLVEHAGHNPWSLRCHKRTLSKMWKNISPSGTFKFILLENVSSEFKYPCILDLKMGTRQYGDEENETKRKRKIDKCAATTSASLAIRLAGMQVYQVNSLSFVCRNKYYGRGLTVEGFKETLYQFLHNGHKLRVDIIDPMIERLLQFHEMLSKQDTFRFYSSSLLLMYDGKEHTSDMKKNTPVREMAPKRSRSLDDSSFITPGIVEWQ